MMKRVVGAAVLFLVGFVLLSNVGEAAHTPATPAPVPDCSNLIVNMMDCLPFLTSNSTLKRPNGTCCDGLQTVLKTNPYCICEGFNQSIQLGIQINMTKALTLPSVCHASAPSITNCGALIPGLAPPPSPAVSPVAPSPSTTGPPTSIVPAPGAGNVTTPAAAPGTSSSSTLAFSAGLLLVAMVVSYF